MIPRPDFKDERSPEWLEVFQLTDGEIPSSHVYMEAQVFHPDSKRFLLHRSSTAHGADPRDPEHHYLVCDLDNGGELSPLLTELGVRAPSLSPDGEYVYYFIDRTEVGVGGSLTLKRTRFDGTDRETIRVIDSTLPGTDFFPSFVYSLSTVSADGRCVAVPCFLRHGEREDLPWGIVVIDVESGDLRVPVFGGDWTNMHAQYCRSPDPGSAHDLMLQQNHSHFVDRNGRRHFSPGGLGNDVHVVRDDGTDFRTMPWGRDGRENQAGHQCWIGRTTRAISEVRVLATDDLRLIEGRAIPDAGHLGARTPGAAPHDLTREFDNPRFQHFGVDAAGTKIIADGKPVPAGGTPAAPVYLGDLPADFDREPMGSITWLCDSGSSWTKEAHPHPFLSPDGRHGFFNSDESGVLQAYMVTGWNV